MSPEIKVILAGPTDLSALASFFRAVVTGEGDDPAAAERGEDGLRRSLSVHDWLRSRSCWLLLARLDEEPAGYLLAARVPKADARAGFLFVDELYVLPSDRRQGVARALLAEAQALAGRLGLAGVRLLVRPENAAARALYRSCGFQEHPTVLCQWTGQAHRDR